MFVQIIQKKKKKKEENISFKSIPTVNSDVSKYESKRFYDWVLFLTFEVILTSLS